MESERCWRLGLIVSELIANAECHAFHNGGGLIYVELLRSTSFVECRVIDNGTSKETICPGRGLEMVDALAKSLGGWIDQNFGPKGATARHRANRLIPSWRNYLGSAWKDRTVRRQMI